LKPHLRSCKPCVCVVIIIHLSSLYVCVSILSSRNICFLPATVCIHYLVSLFPIILFHQFTISLSWIEQNV
jgi:hypothetical protein